MKTLITIAALVAASFALIAPASAAVTGCSEYALTYNDRVVQICKPYNTRVIGAREVTRYALFNSVHTDEE